MLYVTFHLNRINLLNKVSQNYNIKGAIRWRGSI